MTPQDAAETIKAQEQQIDALGEQIAAKQAELEPLDLDIASVNEQLRDFDRQLLAKIVSLSIGVIWLMIAGSDGTLRGADAQDAEGFGAQSEKCQEIRSGGGCERDRNGDVAARLGGEPHTPQC